MKYSSVAVYFMSGTGNSYRVASWIAAVCKQRGIPAKLCQISPNHHVEDTLRKEQKGLLGVVFPTHGFTAPWNVIKYILHLPRGGGKPAFVVATRAGTRIASIPFPGLEGTAGYLIALLLIAKGYIIRGVIGVDMPSNWMSLHWGLNLTNSKFIIDRAKVKADSFIKSILEGNRMFKGKIALLLGLLLSPISLAYLVIGRFFLSKLFFASESCTGCGLCAKSCPLKAIKIVGSDKPRPYWTFSCESCMRCMGYCPNKAVESSHSFAIVLYFIATIPVSTYVLNGLSEVVPIEHYLLFINSALNYIYILVSLFVAYLILSWLIRIPLLNKLFTYTTFTHLYRRYHEPETALSDIVNNKKG